MGDILQHPLDELGNELWDALMKERQLLKTEIALFLLLLYVFSVITVLHISHGMATTEDEKRVESMVRILEGSVVR